MFDYRLSAEDWAQIEAYAKILEVSFLCGHVTSNVLTYPPI